MSEKHLHIISFDVPYPPNYGGVIDIYYKINALHELGVKIHLHTFQYGRSRSNELNEICETVTYYKRKSAKAYFFHALPYIVVSRSSGELLNNLQKDNYPILFEGLHCCYYLSHPFLKDRRKIVRMHNIEHRYYHNLALVEKNLFKRYYFQQEAKKLQKYEAILHQADHILAISEGDTNELSVRYKNTSCVSAFHSNTSLNINQGNGSFALYHGNLSVGENNEAAMFLAQIFSELPQISLHIAGSYPLPELIHAIKDSKNIRLKSNIPTQEIHELIHNAHINILPTFQATGLKLKLLSALYNGRHCIVNSPMVENTGLETLCHIANDKESIKAKIIELMKKPFETEEIKKRENILLNSFSNAVSAKKILELIT